MEHSIYDDSVVEEALSGMLTGEWDRDNCSLGEHGVSARTFAEADIWTGERGLIIIMPDGSEYRVDVTRIK